MNINAYLTFKHKSHNSTDNFIPNPKLTLFSPSIMNFFHHEEPSNPSKRCKFLSSTLKDAFANCRPFRGRLSSSSPEEEDSSSDYDDDEEEVFVSAVISKYKEAKRRRKASLTMESFCWAFSPPTEAGDLFTTSSKNLKTRRKEVFDHDDEDREEEFFSVGSCLSRCSSATNLDAFVSVKTNLSRCSSLSGLDNLQGFRGGRQRSIIFEFRQCEGWPFGLCRKALLLPPLPKSPSESWTWRRDARLLKFNCLI